MPLMCRLGVPVTRCVQVCLICVCIYVLSSLRVVVHRLLAFYREAIEHTACRLVLCTVFIFELVNADVTK